MIYIILIVLSVFFGYVCGYEKANKETQKFKDGVYTEIDFELYTSEWENKLNNDDTKCTTKDTLLHLRKKIEQIDN